MCKVTIADRLSDVDTAGSSSAILSREIKFKATFFGIIGSKVLRASPTHRPSAYRYPINHALTNNDFFYLKVEGGNSWYFVLVLKTENGRIASGHLVN